MAYVITRIPDRNLPPARGKGEKGSGAASHRKDPARHSSSWPGPAGPGSLLRYALTRGPAAPHAQPATRPPPRWPSPQPKPLGARRTRSLGGWVLSAAQPPPRTAAAEPSLPRRGTTLGAALQQPAERSRCAERPAFRAAPPPGRGVGWRAACAEERHLLGGGGQGRGGNRTARAAVLSPRLAPDGDGEGRDGQRGGLQTYFKIARRSVMNAPAIRSLQETMLPFSSSSL
ncbi:translation initiation factor IF-2-like [Mauremys mutica]|uniref:translation initiation factor IF-2-like n=1 Tax=Mauremys mutica TaxID=74926 RepID=UPI001D1410C1|nr:translation initiation factor IF-2-like [Mauremys mutica]